MLDPLGRVYRQLDYPLCKLRGVTDSVAANKRLRSLEAAVWKRSARESALPGDHLCSISRVCCMEFVVWSLYENVTGIAVTYSKYPEGANVPSIETLRGLLKASWRRLIKFIRALE